MNDDAYIEMGYIYTFVLSTIFLSVIFYSAAESSSTKEKEFVKEEFQDTADRVANSIEEASYLALKAPNASFENSIVLTKYSRNYKYKITVTNDTVSIKSLDEEINVKRKLNCGVPCDGAITGDSMTVKIIYHKDTKAIKIS